MPGPEHATNFEKPAIPDLLGAMGQQQATIMGVSGTLNELVGLCPIGLNDPNVSLESKNEFLVEVINEGNLEISPEHEEYVSEATERLGLERNFTVAKSVEEYHQKVAAEHTTTGQTEAKVEPNPSPQSKAKTSLDKPAAHEAASTTSTPQKETASEPAKDGNAEIPVRAEAPVGQRVGEHAIRQLVTPPEEAASILQSDEAAKRSSEDATPPLRADAEAAAVQAQQFERATDYSPNLQNQMSIAKTDALIESSSPVAIPIIDAAPTSTKQTEDRAPEVAETFSIFTPEELERLMLRQPDSGNDILTMESGEEAFDSAQGQTDTTELFDSQLEWGGQQPSSTSNSEVDRADQTATFISTSPEEQIGPLDHAVAAEAWEVELQKDPNELLEDFTAALSILAMSEAPTESSVEAVEPAIEEGNEKATGPLAETVEAPLSSDELAEGVTEIAQQPISLVVTALSERLTALETAEKLEAAAIVQSIAGAVHGLHLLESRGAPEEHIAEVEETLEELCVSLFEAVGITYTETDVEQFVHLLSRPELRISPARPETLAAEAAEPLDLTKVGTREAKHFAHLAFSRPDSSETTPKILGMLALVYANAVKSWYTNTVA